jgi:hypothetical protein
MIKETDEVIDYIGSILVNLDAENLKSDFESISQDDRFGTSKEERINALNKARRINRIIFYLIIAVSIASFVFTKYNDIFTIVLCLIPFFLLLLVPLSNGLIKIETKTVSLYVSIIHELFLPIAALVLRVYIFSPPIINWEKIILPSAVLTLLFVIFFVITNKNEKVQKGTVVCFLFFAMIYSVPAIINLNNIGKHEITETYTPVVYDKKISSGRTKDYYLTVSPWGRHEKDNKIEVSKRLYESLEINDNIRINIFEGKLGIKYYRTGKAE